MKHDAFKRAVFAAIIFLTMVFSGCGTDKENTTEIELPLVVGRQDVEEIDLPCETIEVVEAEDFVGDSSEVE